ncbi:MAG: division/cell wall cluster transcriptional repressor MraZ [Armatimonadota bacterium]
MPHEAVAPPGVRELVADTTANDKHFSGIQQYAVDLKGRVPTLPEHRELLQGDLVCTLGWRPCILITTVERFASIEARLLEQTDLLDPTLHDLVRQFIGHKTIVRLDKQSRITLPRIHRRRTSISIEEDENQVLMIGMGDWIECWSRKVYDEFSDTQWLTPALTDQARLHGFITPAAPVADTEAEAE